MPLRNRVNPFGDIIETPARGLLYGNRGVLHDANRGLVRSWQVRRWIACRLEFKGRRRADQMPPGRFTSLYFLDEATALAAGHRPCAECRREDYRRFQAAWPGASTKAEDMDRALHDERVGPDGSKLLHPAAPNDLPDGAMTRRGWQGLAGRSGPAPRMDAVRLRGGPASMGIADGRDHHAAVHRRGDPRGLPSDAPPERRPDPMTPRGAAR